MKRRTRPAPFRPASGKSCLESFFPGIDSMSDLDGFKILFQLVCMAPPGESDLAHSFLSVFTSSRGLEIRETGDQFRGCQSFLLLKGDCVLFSFSSGVR